MWSEGLRKATRDIVCEFNFIPIGDEVCLKNLDGRFGFIAISDLFAGKLRLVDSEDAAETLYDSVEHLLSDGWVVD
ncbi:MAG: hypothetical protein K9L82_03815 [Chromatiaceae bacterium]|nr:hypothetical protein [Chromatiaceae bacterium]